MESITNREDEYRQLLMNLTKDELQQIRSNWEFKGISHLRKAELVDELSIRIPAVLENWLESVTFPIIELLKEILIEDDLLFVEIQHEYDLKIFEYLRQRGVIFYNREHGGITLYMPLEIKESLRYIFNFQSEILSTIRENTDIVSLSIGLLVYYGIYPVMKVTEKIESILNFKVDPYRYFMIINETTKAFDILHYYKNNVYIEYVMYPEWVLKEQEMRPDLDFYEPKLNELIYAGENIIPPYNKDYKALKRYLRKTNLSNNEIDDILFELNLQINNDVPLKDIFPAIIEIVGFSNSKDLQDLSKLINMAYNNTSQWVLKGNTPTNVFNSLSDTVKINSDSDNNIVDLTEFRKYKEDNYGTVYKTEND